MKGVSGLLIALGLGIAGGLCNWFFMLQKSRQVEMDHFIAVSSGGVKAGEMIRRDQLISVPVPRMYAERLRETAFPYSDLDTVAGTIAFKDFAEGSIVLRQDLQTPPDYDVKQDLGADEVAISVSVDSRGFVPSFLAGGDEVSFIVAKGVSGPQEVGDTGMRVAQATEMLGPFSVLALGNRRGEAKRAKAAGASTSQENILTIRVKKVSDNQLEPKAQELIDKLRLSNNQALGLVIHSGKKAS